MSAQDVDLYEIVDSSKLRPSGVKCPKRINPVNLPVLPSRRSGQAQPFSDHHRSITECVTGCVVKMFCNKLVRETSIVVGPVPIHP